MEKTKNNILLQTAKAILLAIIFNLAYVLLFAGVLKIFNLDNNTIKLINQVAKIIILLTVGIICISGEKKIIKGLLFGLLTLTISYIIFILLSSQAIVPKDLCIEIVFGTIVGTITGVVVKILK